MDQISSEEVTTEFIKAEDLRDLTISPEDRFERDRVNVLTNLMDGMVQQASNFGVYTHLANLNPQFDPALLSTITKNLIELGYEVKTENKEDKDLGKFIVLGISWEEKPALEAVAEEVVQEAVAQETEAVSEPDQN